MVPRRHAAAAGCIAAAVALGTGELVSSSDRSGSSLVTAVGDETIDRFAASLKDVAVALFGQHDKVALVVGIAVVAICIGGLVGVLASARPAAGPLAFAAFGLLGFLAFRRVPLADARAGAVASSSAAVVGAVALQLLLRLAPTASPARGEEPAPVRGAPRRAFLAAAGALTAGAAGAAVLARRLQPGDPAAIAREEVALPAASESTPVPAGTFEEPGLSPYLTPTSDFFRIDTALITPRIDRAAWRLQVSGRVDRPFELTYDELLALDAVEVPVTLQCVSNEVGGDLVGTATWRGVPLEVLLDRAGVQPEGTQVVGRAVDGWTAGFPTRVLDDGRSALVAYAMNGEVLSARHGFPARLVVAGLYGYVSATKWLTEVELTGLDELDGYWISRGWAKDGPIKLASRIDVARADPAAGPDRVLLAGVAWAPTRGIRAVEVQLDDGPWERAELGEVASDETWVQWRVRTSASAGTHEARVRAVAADGEVQTDRRRPPAPDGATGLHARRFQLSDHQ